MLSSPRLADGGGGNATGQARCYALVLDGHCRLRLEGSEIRAEGGFCRMISNVTTRGGGGGGHGIADNNIGGHPKEAAAGAALIVCHYNNVMNWIALGGKPNAGA